VAEAAFCTRCGGELASHDSCDREGRPGGPLDPPRFCADCGGRMTVQVIPTGYSASCLRCERRARFAAAGVLASRTRSG
jgi:uncharacterized paraquat-inducible protein A